MNSITFSVGYILIVLIVDVSGTDYLFLSEATTIRASPFKFIYDAQSDYLLMIIKLENIPSHVTEVYVTHNNGGGQSGISPLKVLNIENNSAESMILGRLVFTEILVEVELLRDKTDLCARKTIAEGRDGKNWTPTLKEKTELLNVKNTDKRRIHYDDTGSCLVPKNCIIVMDFKNKCDDDFMCHIHASQYICTIQKAKPPYILRLTYGDNTIIAIKIPVPNLRLIMTLELFDVNTSINVFGEQVTGSEIIPLTAANEIKDYNVTKFKYSEATEVQFSCQQYANLSNVINLYVCIINTTDNTLKIFKDPIQRKFELADNGTILCCLYCTGDTRRIATAPKKINKIKQNELYSVTITRLVVDKTMLIYQRNHSVENIADQPTKPADGIDQALSSSQNNDYSWLLYVFVPLTGVSTLILAFCIISKKRWFKNSQPVEETVEFPNQAHQNQVLYADINFVNVSNEPRAQTEESHYAHIIGELHPL